jgi:hypothetical protein
MKNIAHIFVFILLFFSINAYGQWDIKYYQGDSINQIPHRYIYTYDDEVATLHYSRFMLNNENKLKLENSITIETKEGIYNTYYSKLLEYNMSKVYLYFYNNDNILLYRKKLNVPVSNSQDVIYISSCFVSKRTIRKIINFLEESDGYIILKTSRFENDDMIFRINCKLK